MEVRARIAVLDIRSYRTIHVVIYLKYNLIFKVKLNLKRVETFRKGHTDKNDVFVTAEAEQQYVSI